MGPDVVTLPVQLSWIEEGVENPENGQPWNHLGIEGNPHDLRMPGLLPAHLLVSRVLDVPPAVSGDNLVNSL